MKNKLSQQQLAFLMLLQNKDSYLPAWKFVGEVEIYGEMEFLSYKVPARLSELYTKMECVKRQQVKGVSGAIYYEYIINKIEWNNERLEFYDFIENLVKSIPENQNYKRNALLNYLKKYRLFD